MLKKTRATVLAALLTITITGTTWTQQEAPAPAKEEKAEFFTKPSLFSRLKYTLIKKIHNAANWWSKKPEYKQKNAITGFGMISSIIPAATVAILTFWKLHRENPWADFVPAASMTAGSITWLVSMISFAIIIKDCPGLGSSWIKKKAGSSIVNNTRSLSPEILMTLNESAWKEVVTTHQDSIDQLIQELLNKTGKIPVNALIALEQTAPTVLHQHGETIIKELLKQIHETGDSDYLNTSAAKGYAEACAGNQEALLLVLDALKKNEKPRSDHRKINLGAILDTLTDSFFDNEKIAKIILANRHLADSLFDLSFDGNDTWFQILVEYGHYSRVITEIIKGTTPQTFLDFFFQKGQKNPTRNFHTYRTAHCIDNSVSILAALLQDEKTALATQQALSAGINNIATEIVAKLAEKDPASRAVIIRAIGDNIEIASAELIQTVYEKSFGDDRTHLEKALQQSLRNVKEKSFFNLLTGPQGALFLLTEFPHYFGTTNKKITQTEHHLASYLDEIQNNFGNRLTDDAAKTMFIQLHNKEQEEHAKGRYTFVHAQQWKWHFLADIFKRLWELSYDEQVTDYQFLRFEARPDNLNAASKKREDVLEQRETKYRSIMLYMNHAVFGNTNAPGNCSAEYWFRNIDCSGRTTISPRHLFSKLGLRRHYQNYAEEFQQLEKLHNASSQYGNMLLLSMTAKQLEKAVVTGHRRTATVDGINTDNVKTIIDALQDDQQKINRPAIDNMEYCMILTHDFALDPHNGPRIYSFNAPDHEKFAQYEQLRNEIFEQLAADIAADRTQEMTPAAA